MPTGERQPRRHQSRGQRGFTYLVMLLVLALGAAGASALGTQWRAAAQREREAELLFRGRQIAQALGRYAAATPQGQPRAPERLDELLEDRRGDTPLHHLRRLYADPFTGRADWQLITDASGRVLGVRSRAPHPAWRRDLPAEVKVARQPSAVADWHFMTEAGPDPGPNPRRIP